MENKNQFIEILLKNYDKFTWTRDNFEFSTEIGNYLVILDSGRDRTFLNVTTHSNDGEFFQYSVDTDENENIGALYNLVFDCWNKQREKDFWETATLELSKEIIKSPFFKIE